MLLPVIHAENLSKAYQIGEFSSGTLTKDIERWWLRMRGKEDPFLKIGEDNDRTVKSNSNIIWSLKDLNFQIVQGDAVGIIGKNGAGKSTLLKILSRVTTPTSGCLKIKGRIASLLEVGSGFHPELTGRENIFLNGAILGMRKFETKRKFDEIIDFSGVQKYIDTPVRRYSSGMYMRLAFAVAAHLESEILVVDEVLAVGDGEFQKKCLGKMGQVSKGEGRTVLFVSHDLNAVSQLCNNGIMLEKGKIACNGRIGEVISAYLSNKSELPVHVNPLGPSNKLMLIRSVQIKNDKGQVNSEFFYNQPVIIEFGIEINDPSVKADLFVIILDERKRRIFACEKNGIKPEMKLMIEPNMLVRGNYSIHAFINIPHFEQVDVVEDVCKFRVVDSGSILFKHGDYDYGNVFGRYNWV